MVANAQKETWGCEVKTLKSPLFGSHIPHGRAREFEDTIAHPECVAYEIAGMYGEHVYREYPSRKAALDAVWRAEQSLQGRITTHLLVKCPHGVRFHC